MSTLGKRLIKVAKEARTIARGKAEPKSFRVHMPADIDVAAIRKRRRHYARPGCGQVPKPALVITKADPAFSPSELLV